MKFNATIALPLTTKLGLKEDRENTLLCIFMNALWSGIPQQNREPTIVVLQSNLGALDIDSFTIEVELNCRSAEIVKDMLYESLISFFDPEYSTDIEVEINDEL